mmetsp:Transcript_43464/g.69499  ORF Transcript_43464/g.69499 Transcript_43464/m.69499 type:complete len:338 (-) Transcript_43464:55-1068(-)
MELLSCKEKQLAPYSESCQACRVLESVSSAFEVLTFAMFTSAGCVNMSASAVHFAICPFTFISRFVAVRHRSESMFLVVCILSAIFATIRPRVASEAMDDRIGPMAMIQTPVTTHQRADTINTVALPRTMILRAIRPKVDSVPSFYSIAITTHESGSLRPCLDSEAFLMIAVPLAFVCCLVFAVEGTHSVGNIVAPLTNVDFAVSMLKLSRTVCLVVKPQALVKSAIRPTHRPITMSLISFPLTRINCATLESVGWSFSRWSRAWQFSQGLQFTLKVASFVNRLIIIGIQNGLMQLLVGFGIVHLLGVFGGKCSIRKDWIVRRSKKIWRDVRSLRHF